LQVTSVEVDGQRTMHSYVRTRFGNVQLYTVLEFSPTTLPVLHTATQKWMERFAIPLSTLE
jgi:hypothetical protein